MSTTKDSELEPNQRTLINSRPLIDTDSTASQHQADISPECSFVILDDSSEAIGSATSPVESLLVSSDNTASTASKTSFHCNLTEEKNGERYIFTSDHGQCKEFKPTTVSFRQVEPCLQNLVNDLAETSYAFSLITEQQANESAAFCFSVTSSIQSSSALSYGKETSLLQPNEVYSVSEHSTGPAVSTSEIKPPQCQDIHQRLQSQSQTADVTTTPEGGHWACEQDFLRACITKQISFKDFVQTNEDYSVITKLLPSAENLSQKLKTSTFVINDFVEFVNDTRAPLEYLLKREQNLTDFIRPIKQLLNKKKYKQIPRVSLRYLIDILLSNSDSFLRSKLMRLLSKRNPVPMLQAPLASYGSFRFIPEIIHTWNFSHPTLLSFGIGPCQGKSSLLNATFLSHFELSTTTAYSKCSSFDRTVDIDFGYHFLGTGRCINVADVHGEMSEQTIGVYATMFDGFLIHIEDSFLADKKNISLIGRYLKVLPEKSYKVVIVRDVNEKDLSDDEEEQHFAQSQLFSSIPVFSLPKNADSPTDSNMQKIDRLRATILQSVQDKPSCNKRKECVREQIKKHLNSSELDHLNGIEATILDIRSSLLLATEKEYPVYYLFTRICHYRKRRNKLNFYGNEEHAAPSEAIYPADSQALSMFELQNTIYTWEQDFKRIISCGSPFELFSAMVTNSQHRLQDFEILSIELKGERERVLGARELCANIHFDKCLTTEMHWRNVIVCYERQTASVQQQLSIAYGDLVENGMPFEIIDGDNFHFQAEFLQKSLATFRDKRIFVLSVVGPQNSGKSTLLNYMFGTLFDVRDGRCTRGVYGSIVKWNSPVSDYILLIDTEGLMSMEKTDAEYDRRLILFCLAVSHLVVVNTAGTFTADLSRLLQICGDSLKHLQVNKLNGPSVHVVLNQKSDPNLDNHRAAIEQLEREMKATHVDEYINIGRDTFHTLPTAFQKTNLISTSKKDHLTLNAIAIDTQETFIEQVQELRKKLLGSASFTNQKKSERFSDLLGWIKFAYDDVFDIFQKFPDLTMFNDVQERRQDTRMQEQTREAITNLFTVKYQALLQKETESLDERETKDFYRTTFGQHLDSLEANLKNVLKLCGAMEGGWVEKRSARFLHSQVDGTRDAWCASALNSKERSQMEELVRTGASFLRKLIIDATNEGRLNVDQATSKFDHTWEKQTTKIRDGFIPETQLQKAFTFIYKNYNIFEKDNLPESASILPSLPRVHQPRMQDLFEPIKNPEALQYFPIQELNFTSISSITYTLKTILNLEYLFQPTLLEAYHNYLANHRTITQKIFSGEQQHNHDTPWEPKLYEHLCKALHKKIQSSKEVDEDLPDVWKKVVNLDYCFKRLAVAIKKKVWVEGDVFRPINIDVIRDVANATQDLSQEINDEFSIFKFTMSKQLRIAFHECAVLILTRICYEEQWSHFKNVLKPVLSERNDLLQYFLRMVVPDHEADQEFAKALVNSVYETLEGCVKQEAAGIISKQMTHDQKALGRVALLQQLEMQAASSTEDWLVRFILQPSSVLEEVFETNWAKSETEVNRQIEVTKSTWKVTLNEFSTRLHTMRDRLQEKKAHLTTYITDSFKPSGGIAYENLTNAGKCFANLVYEYFTKSPISDTYTITRDVHQLQYDLQPECKQTFENLNPPSESLVAIMKMAKSKFDIISISNAIQFFDYALIFVAQMQDRFGRMPSTFAELNRTAKAQQHFKACGCGHKCPCCGRLCDFDHTTNTSAVSNAENRHRCTRGHQIRAMGGYKRKHDNQASLLYCEQVVDTELIVQRSEQMLWSDFKKKHSNWEWPLSPSSSTPRCPPEQSELFSYIWVKVGEKLCRNFNNGMLYVIHQSEPTLGNHYIFVLDKSDSMKGNKWKVLVEAIENFLRVRIENGRSDLISIIVFATGTVVPYLQFDISTISLPEASSHLPTCTTRMNPKCTCKIIDTINKAQLRGTSTNFAAAFDSLMQVLVSSKAADNIVDYPITIIFMTDGEPDKYPEKELQTLASQHKTISRFVTMGLGSYNREVLEKINATLGGAFVDIKTTEDLVRAYAEVAHST